MTTEVDKFFEEGDMLTLKTEFLSALAGRDISSALRLSREILVLDPNDETVREFEPLLERILMMVDESGGEGDKQGNDEEEEEGGSQSEEITRPCTGANI